MLPFLLVLSFPVSTTALLVARREYRRRGRLSFLGLGLVCIMLLVPNLILHYNASYTLPSTFSDFVGVILAAGGILILLPGMLFFRSPAKVLCLDPGELTIAGPYRWSRNPQYLGWFLFLAGFALNDPSSWALAGLVVNGISIHLLVLVEEEHLLRVFGEGYQEFKRQVPRYLGWRGKVNR